MDAEDCAENFKEDLAVCFLGRACEAHVVFIQAVGDAQPAVELAAFNTDSIIRTAADRQMIQIQNCFHLFQIGGDRIARNVDHLAQFLQLDIVRMI